MGYGARVGIWISFGRRVLIEYTVLLAGGGIICRDGFMPDTNMSVFGIIQICSLQRLVFCVLLPLKAPAALTAPSVKGRLVASRSAITSISSFLIPRSSFLNHHIWCQKSPREDARDGSILSTPPQATRHTAGPQLPSSQLPTTPQAQHQHQRLLLRAPTHPRTPSVLHASYLPPPKSGL